MLPDGLGSGQNIGSSMLQNGKYLENVVVIPNDVVGQSNRLGSGRNTKLAIDTQLQKF